MALRTKPHDAEAWLEYGTTLAALEDYAGATAAFDAAIADRPGFVAAWNDRGVALRALGRAEEARENFERAAALQPNFAAATTNLANLELASSRFERAEALYRRALRDDATSINARTGLGRALGKLGRKLEALRELARAVELAPSSFDALLALITFQLGTRRLAEALGACDRFLRLAPGHSGGLGLRAAIGRECRDERYSHLLDVERWLSVRDLPDDAEFHAELTVCLTSRLPLNTAPPQHATQQGLHSGPLWSHDQPALARLEAMIENELSAYVDVHGSADAAVRSRPRAVALHTWGVVLGADGFQLPHLHPDAWLSGVYYVAVPSTGPAQADARAGCLELGPPDRELLLNRESARKLIRPKPGRLVIFPSWLYHGTVPHGAPGLRISIAFDCVRAIA